MTAPSADLRVRLTEDLRTAMRARDRLRTDVLRTTLAAVANAEAVPTTARPNVAGRDEPTEVDRRELDATTVAGIVRREVEELRAEVGLRRAHGIDLGDLDARIAVLLGYVDPEGAEGGPGPIAP